MIAKRYEREGAAIQKMLSEQRCDRCDSLIVLSSNKEGSPDTDSPQITHDIFCDRSN